jgi:hypothetical protein
MVARIIEISLRYRAVVLLGAFALLAAVIVVRVSSAN